MTSRLLNRRELRKQHDEVEQSAQVDQTSAAGVVVPRKGRKAKAPAVPRVKKPRKKKEPVRRIARWGVFDVSMKQVAIFDFWQRAEADQKVAELKAKKNAFFFLQIVKEPMPEPAPAEGAAAS
jgi:hypothetical protein